MRVTSQRRWEYPAHLAIHIPLLANSWSLCDLKSPKEGRPRPRWPRRGQQRPRKYLANQAPRSRYACVVRHDAITIPRLFSAALSIVIRDRRGRARLCQCRRRHYCFSDDSDNDARGRSTRRHSYSDIAAAIPAPAQAEIRADPSRKEALRKRYQPQAEQESFETTWRYALPPARAALRERVPKQRYDAALARTACADST